MSVGNDLFESALSAEGVVGKLASLARSIYTQESGGGKNTKTSNAGARGGMQIIPGTFNQVADKGWSIDDPLHNARAGIRYLKVLDKQAGGDPALTAAGYYGGPGGLEKARRGIAVSDPRNPNAPNTLQYGQQVAARITPGNSPAPLAQPVEAAPPVTQVAATQVTPQPPPVDTGIGLSTLSPELLAMSHQAAPQAAAQADAWQQFLQSMSSGREQAPVQVADLSYGPGAPAVMAPQAMGRAPANLAPNFAAFQSWRGKRA